MDLIFDMETQDPDDFFTLCLLATYPGVQLRAVTITPGTREQVGLVRHVLDRLDRSAIPVGSRNPDSPSRAISGFHHKFLGHPPAAEPDAIAHDLLARTFTEHPDSVLLTGAALHNGRLLLANHPDVTIRRWVAQGGFAGDSIVPPEHRLAKFAGRETCATYNFGGDPKGALAMLSSPRIHSRDLVSKNVCHGIVYDQPFHERLKPYRDAHPGLALLYDGMDRYLREHTAGKAFHDPLAACVAIRRDIVTLVEVEMYRAGGEWGERRALGTSTFISVSVDREAFFDVLRGKREA